MLAVGKPDDNRESALKISILQHVVTPGAVSISIPVTPYRENQIFTPGCDPVWRPESILTDSEQRRVCFQENLSTGKRRCAVCMQIPLESIRV